MSDKRRWMYGDTNAVVAAVDSGTVIAIGDLVYQDVDDAKPASAQTDQGSETANQELFATHFLGVAMQRSRSGDTDMVRVATTGVFEFDCMPLAAELGDLVGPDATNLTQVVGENPGSTRDVLCDQRVARVSESKYAIGRISKRSGTKVTSVLVDVRSTVITGGVIL